MVNSYSFLQINPLIQMCKERLKNNKGVHFPPPKSSVNNYRNYLFVFYSQK